MTCQKCSEEGHDVEMEEKGYVHIPSDGITAVVITLLQCPKCKSVWMESEIQ